MQHESLERHFQTEKKIPTIASDFSFSCCLSWKEGESWRQGGRHEHYPRTDGGTTHFNCFLLPVPKTILVRGRGRWTKQELSGMARVSQHHYNSLFLSSFLPPASLCLGGSSSHHLWGWEPPGQNLATGSYPRCAATWGRGTGRGRGRQRGMLCQPCVSTLSHDRG